MSVVKNILMIQKKIGNIKLFKNNFNVGQKKKKIFCVLYNFILPLFQNRCPISKYGHWLVYASLAECSPIIKGCCYSLSQMLDSSESRCAKIYYHLYYPMSFHHKCWTPPIWSILGSKCL